MFGRVPGFCPLSLTGALISQYSNTLRKDIFNYKQTIKYSPPNNYVPLPHNSYPIAPPPRHSSSTERLSALHCQPPQKGGGGRITHTLPAETDFFSFFRLTGVLRHHPETAQDTALKKGAPPVSEALTLSLSELFPRVSRWCRDGSALSTLSNCSLLTLAYV